MRAPIPANEERRLRDLREFEVLDTVAEQSYDDITYLASQLCATPIALVSLVDQDRQWFKARVGLGATETSRDLAFCAHAILEPSVILEVPDTLLDARFADNALVTSDPNIRFYAGAPIVTDDGSALGTLCVIDRVPRELTEAQRASLQALSRQVMAQLELRRALAVLRANAHALESYQAKLEESQLRLELANQKLALESLTDTLTGLPNRRAFDRALADEWERATRNGNDLSLLMIDVDGFKGYNDQYEHQVGDAALRVIAQALEGGRRTTDTLARYGGEEFAIILQGTSEAGAEIMGERIRRAIAVAPVPHRQLTVSVGTATRSPDVESPEALVKAADAALYRAKMGGRNRVVTASMAASPAPSSSSPQSGLATAPDSDLGIRLTS